MRLSNNNIALIIICAALIVGLYFFNKDGGKKVVFEANTDTNEVLAQNDSLGQKIAEIDTDNDGLKDWEESLWKTDPKNPDSDDDGTSDGEETANNRDPRKKGPDDTLKPESFKGTEGDDGLTATEKLSQEAFRQLVEAKKSGKTLSAEEAQTIISNIVESKKPQFEAIVYAQSDILTISNESPAALRTFGNALGEIHKKNNPVKYEDSVLLLARAVKEKDPKIPTRLILNANAFHADAVDSLVLSVPKSAVVVHLKLINALSRMESVIRSFAKIYDDPVMAVVGVSEYKIAIKQLADALKGLREYFALRGIIFGANEPAHQLINPTPLKKNL